MPTLINIIDFIKDITGESDISDNTDLFSDCGIVGDDFHELIEKYADKFSVDMAGYLWYFHSDEEGQNIGGLIVKPPNLRVKRIPVTPKLLLDFANLGKWKIEYPKHKIPKRRYDILINQILFGGFIIFLVYKLIKLIIK